MHTRTAPRPRLVTCLAILLMALATMLAPSTASAVGDLPDEMVDPIAAMEPAAPDVNEPAIDPPADDGIAEAAAIEPATPTASAVPTRATTNVGNGSLPFTGLDSGQAIMLLLVGSLFVSAGVTAWIAGRPVSSVR